MRPLTRAGFAVHYHVTGSHYILKHAERDGLRVTLPWHALEYAGAWYGRFSTTYDRTMAQVHMSEAEIAGNFAAALEKVRRGIEVVV